MGLIYRRADLKDLEALTRTRVEVLRAANGLSGDADLSAVLESSRAYYERALHDGSHTALLVMDGDTVVGTGGVSYFSVMPTVHNPTGRKAYIMNIYTKPEYRRRGIARETLFRLVEDARRRGVSAISLEATAMGRPLYERFGFTAMKNEMELTGCEENGCIQEERER